jgi:hypothetical protein
LPSRTHPYEERTCEQHCSSGSQAGYHCPATESAEFLSEWSIAEVVSKPDPHTTAPRKQFGWASGGKHQRNPNDTEDRRQIPRMHDCLESA